MCPVRCTLWLCAVAHREALAPALKAVRHLRDAAAAGLMSAASADWDRLPRLEEAQPSPAAADLVAEEMGSGAGGDDAAFRGTKRKRPEAAAAAAAANGSRADGDFDLLIVGGGAR